jgi:hypothetical protein
MTDQVQELAHAPVHGWAKGFKRRLIRSRLAA